MANTFAEAPAAFAPSPRAAEASRITQAEAEAMLRAAFNLFRLWGLGDAEGRILLGDVAARTYARWKAGAVGPIGRDAAARLSNLMGVHKGVRHMFKEPERAYAWMRRPNAAFGGQSALERMLAGEIADIIAVRAYLDAARGGW